MHPIIKSQYVMLEARHLELGAGYIMETEPPFYLGKIYTYKDQDEFLTAEVNNAWPGASVPGYQIIIRFQGSLQDGRRLKVSEQTHGAIERTLKNMADFFYKEKIEMHKGYYKKFYITPYGPMSRK